MKMKFLRLSLLLATVMLGLQACNDDVDTVNNYLPNALVTLKTNAQTGAFYMQLNDSVTLVPTNVKTAPYNGKELRALVNCKQEGTDDSHSSKSVYVNWIDTIRTKSMAMHTADDDTAFGTDPIEVVNTWKTVVEDGYFTLQFRTLFGNKAVHEINLLKGSQPYEVEIKHNAHGDVDGYAGDGLVAFRLDKLPDTEGKTVTLTVKWKSYSGEKQAQFKYCTRK